jgi:hypothetical protein
LRCRAWWLTAADIAPGARQELAKFLYDKDGAALNGHHEHFMDDARMQMMVGDEYILIEHGNKVG